MSNVEDIARDQLRSFVDRIERLEEEKKTTADDIKDVYAEAKGSGFDTKVLRRVIALRKLDQSERAEFEAILELYLEALGMGIQERLPFPEESPRTQKPTTTVQIFDRDGTPLHEPVSIETMKATVDQVRRGKARRAVA